LVVVLLSVCTSLAQEGKPEFSITIHGPESMKVGTYIVVDILVTNISNHVIAFDDNDFPVHGEANFGVDVFDAQGELAPRTAVEKAMSTGHSMQRDLKPGEIVKESVALSQLFDMKPGRYTVVVSRPDYQAGHPTTQYKPGDSDLSKPVSPPSGGTVNPPPQKPKAIAKSNTITLTVVPE